MLSVGLPCFLLIPNERNERLLVPGKVAELNNAGKDATVVFEEPVTLGPGDEGIIFADFRNKFFQQGIRVTAALPPDTAVQLDASQTNSTTLSFTRVGDPIAADGRGAYRVSVAASSILARVDKQSKCHVVDISPEGCAVICNRPLMVGRTVNVVFTCEGVSVEGPMKVQTEKQLRSGLLRFGLFAADKKSPARRGLEKLSITMQRLQLKRLAGAA